MAIMSWKRSWRPVAVSCLISGLVILAVAGLRAVGAFQFFELKTYDLWLCWQPHDAKWASPVVIVGVTEDDIQALKSSIIPDAVLADALEKLSVHSPRAIGIDIYRDNIEVGEGRERLNEVVTQYKNIVAVFRVGLGNDEEDKPVSPLPVLVGTPRVGFSNQVDDADVDGVIRRGLLYLKYEEKMEQSLALRLALLYLEREGVVPEADESDGTQVRLGKAVLTRFKPNDGAYVDADDRGYQILLDYKSPSKFKMYSLMEVLEGRVKAKSIHSKIVLIGYVAKSKKDVVYTPIDPYLQGVKIHGYIADQLVRSALIGQEPMAVWSQWQEFLWIVLWGSLGGVLGFKRLSPPAFFLALFAGLGLLAGADYWAFRNGLWAVVVSPAVVWTVSACAVEFYRQKGTIIIVGDNDEKDEAPQRKYRVFISWKSEDEPHAREVYDCLTQAGISTFFSEVSLKEDGKTTFAGSIYKALEQSKHLVLVTSDIELARTNWVQAEWMTFINEINSGFKTGNVVTVIVGDVQIKDLPVPLRQFQVVSLTPDGLEKLLNFVR